MTAICFVCNLPILSHQVGLVWQGGNGWDDLVREQVSGNAPIDTPIVLKAICCKYAYYQIPDFAEANTKYTLISVITIGRGVYDKTAIGRSQRFRHPDL